jgi:hypothetical protein
MTHVKDENGNIYKVSALAGALPEGFEWISIPEELLSEEPRFLEEVDGVVQKKATADADKAKEATQIAVKAAIDLATQIAVKAAIDFGSQLLVDFASENIILGITADNMTKTVRQNMSEIILALQTGSLYDAIDEIDAIPAESKDGKYITDARLQEYRDKITNFLGI